MRRILIALSMTLAACGVEQTSQIKAENVAVSSPIFLDESQYLSEMESKVIPLWNTAEKGHFIGHEGAHLYFRKLINPNAQGKIAIAHGYTENHLKYRELAYNFYQAGYSVFFFDQRGHGLSDRFVKTDKEMVYVKQWADYGKDLKIFLTTIVPKDDLPLFLFAHSMGGATSAELLTDEPGLVKAAVLSSPMLGIDTGNYPRPVALAAATAATALGQGQKYGPGEGPVNAATWILADASTSSAPRFDLYKRDAIGGGIAMGGGSFNWIKEGLLMNIRMENKAKASKATTPILLGQAGKDARVYPEQQTKFCQAAPNCKLSIKAASRHEIWNEVDAIRQPWILEILAFFEQHSR